MIKRSELVRDANIAQIGAFLAAVLLQLFRLISSDEFVRFPGSWMATLTVNMIGLISSILNLGEWGGSYQDIFG